MQTLQHSYHGLSLVFTLNWDRLINIVTLVVALLAGAYVGSLL
ncbi:hypothetical protein [Marinibacterium profundimaris]|nr:hypothetical protein [Marinibacterium profundimaris]